MRIGISGWRYEPWRGVFYPKELRQKKELHYASRQFNSVEINGSFYSMQTNTSYQLWFDETPDDFLFSVKGPKYITHMKRLKDVRLPLANFFNSGVLNLQHKLGPFLWQFPPNFIFKEERFREFFKLLPRSVSEAAALTTIANRGDAFYGSDVRHSDKPLRHCIEVRHRSFECPDFIDLLREEDIALVFADTAGLWPYMEDLTSNFIYLRLHGDSELYVSGYDEATLQFWADRILNWATGGEPKDALTLSEQAGTRGRKDVHVYFDNDAKVHAPFDALRLTQILNSRIGVKQKSKIKAKLQTPPEPTRAPSRSVSRWQSEGLRP